ncbi:MAG: alpha/beta fold hydrolase [Myxococcales bacterium]|nr:alpha/beta fold hydrolase [Myxococcales bacterium]MDH3845437.1 alpha/beta fold hydrolase [Myxococcales bacterium]
MAIPVAVFPGFSAGDLSTFFLRRHLQGAGYRVHRWRLGINRGNVPALVPKVVARTEARFQRHEEPVALVGWSLGGVLAREVARERPDLVKCIVTLGTPVVGGPKYTSTAPFYEKVLNVDLDALERTASTTTTSIAVTSPVPEARRVHCNFELELFRHQTAVQEPGQVGGDRRRPLAAARGLARPRAG